MRSYQHLILEVMLFVGACFFLFAAGIAVPENPQDLSDTSGLPAVKIYTVALLIIGFFAVVMSCLGALITTLIKVGSFSIKLAIFTLSNALLLLSCFLGVFVICSYVLDTKLGVAGIILYLAVIVLILAGVPKRNNDQKSGMG